MLANVVMIYEKKRENDRILDIKRALWKKHIRAIGR
jgi:hypothetical protein